MAFQLGNISKYIAGGVGCAVGWITSSMIAISSVLINLISKLGVKGIDAGKLRLIGIGSAILIYLAVIGLGWRKGGLIGTFLVGFGVGAILEELTSL